MSRTIKALVATLFFVFITSLSFGQNRQLGTWKMYLPYYVSHGLCDAGDKVYCAAAQSIFSYDKNSGTIQTYDKTTGLSDINVKLTAYDPSTKTLAIVYSNSNFDLLVNGTDVFNIPDIEHKSQTGGTSITINGVSFYNGNAYLSTDIGVSVINLTTKLITDTYIIGANGAQVRVYSCTIDGTNIYAATDQGTKYAPLTSPNLLDFNSWNTFGPAQGLPVSAGSFITAYNGKVYTAIGGTGFSINGNTTGTDTLFEYNGTNWAKKWWANLNTIHSLDAVDSSLYFGIWYDTTNTSSGFQGEYDRNGNLHVDPSNGHSRPLNWFASNGASWEADYFNGLFKNGNGIHENIVPDGPFTANVFRMAVKNGVLYLAPGGVDDSWDYDYNRDGLFVYKNNQWTFQNANNNSSLANFSDILCTASVTSTGKSYFGSFYAGLIRWDNATGKIDSLYDQNNSILEGAIGDGSRTKISCLTVDRSDNLWIGNAGAPSMLKVIRNDGTWRKFALPIQQPLSLLKQIIVDQQNQVWCLTRQSDGLVVFSYGADMDNTSDDQAIYLTTGQGAGGLPDANVFSLAEDKDGNIWVGTNQGIAVYYCAGSVLQPGSCDGQQIKVVAADGYVAYLFGTESVRAIAVDAANRKWIGTTNGVWLISADGQTQLLNFNTSNSPMPANQVTDIQIDDLTGEVYIGTLGGLVSYRGDAIGDCTDCSSALVYPNPVKPDYDGPIAIKGLATNANVKITDATGTLVYQGKANGSQMVWNGRNYNGVRAKSGVYLVFAADDMGKEKHVAKILVMN